LLLEEVGREDGEVLEEQGPVPLGWQWTCFTSVRGGLDSRARRVGGGSGDDFGRRVPVGGFRSQAPGHRFGYDFGPPSFEFERARFERDPRFGSEYFGSSAPAFQPTYEQMARHWFSTHPVSDHLLIHLTVDFCRSEAWRTYGS